MKNIDNYILERLHINKDSMKATSDSFKLDICEQIMNTAITTSHSLSDPIVQLRDFEPYYNYAQKVIYHAFDEFEEYKNNYKRKSKIAYNKQVEFVTFTAERKIKSLEETIDKLKLEGKKAGVIHMNEKHIEKIKAELEIKLKQLEKDQYIEPDLSDVAIGVLIVE